MNYKQAGILSAILGFGAWAILILVMALSPRQSWQPKPAVLNQAWGWVQSCTNVVTPRGKNPNGSLENVVWKTFEDGAMNDTFPGAILGVTVRTAGDPIDTIYIDRTHQDTVWTLAHELLHHVLADESVWGSAHPFVPFAFPCHLMVWQQGNDIGIMGQGSGKKTRRTP